MSRNSRSGTSVGVYLGIVLFLAGFAFAPLFIVGIVVVIIAIIRESIKSKQRWNNTSERYGQIKSGVNRNMSSVNEVAGYAKSNTAYNNGNTILANKFGSDSARYNSTNNSVKTFNVKYDECELDGCNPNECPVCKAFSASGYCSLCGYRFRH